MHLHRFLILGIALSSHFSMLAAQGRMAQRVMPATCASADSLLGPPANEQAIGISGSYNPVSDSTRISAFLGRRAPVEALYTHLRFHGRGPYAPVGLPLGMTFTGGKATRIARDTSTYPVTLLLEPSQDSLQLGAPVITPLDKTGSSPATTVNAVVTRAALLGLVHSSRATIRWASYTVRLSGAEIGVLRALYRAALCAPAGIPSAS
jgi:hypothetical protein